MSREVEIRLAQAKQRASVLSVVFNVTSAAVKLVAALITGSVSLMGEAIHSTTDIVASLVALFSVRAANAPPDDDHPYGHGKIESLAGLTEAVFLLLVVGYVGWQSVFRLIYKTPVEKVEVGLLVMIVSSAGAFLVGAHVGRVGRETGSLALRSNSQHLAVDGWTSVAVVVALLIVRLTGYAQADGIVGIVMTIWLAYGAYKMIREAAEQLIDRRLPDEEIARVIEILRGEPEVLNYHRLRTRHSGSVHYVDVHVVVPREWTIVQAHDLADRLEQQIRTDLAPAHVVIHVEPYEPDREEARNRM